MNVAVQGELGFVLEGGYRGSVSEAPQLRATVCWHCKADQLLSSAWVKIVQLMLSVGAKRSH